jgi:glycolate oxidase FAD binding subunit
MTVFRPTNAAQTAELIAWAAAEHETLALVGGGSKNALGRACVTDHTLDLSAQCGIIDYDPAELVLTAKAATPMAEIATELDRAGQMLAFEPPDWSGLLPSTGQPTLGGTIACNHSGPRRVRAGAARDHLLGFAAINGWGDPWKSGGKVVKNVTGYDMCKLQAGAFGTLSALLEISVRVLPRPAAQCTIVLSGYSDDDAIRALAAALNAPHEVSAAAHLPAAIAARTHIGADGPLTLLRLEGPHPSVDFRAAAFDRAHGGITRLMGEDSARLWQEIAAVAPLLGADNSLVWRICPTPSGAPAILREVRETLDEVEAFYDWGGGLLWLAIDPSQAGADAGAAVIRTAVATFGGHAMLLRAPAEMRKIVPVFEPAPVPLMALTRRVKDSFDPNAVLNPGRMHEGV